MKIYDESEAEISLLLHKKGGFILKTLGNYPEMKSLVKFNEKFCILSNNNQLYSIQSNSISRMSSSLRILEIYSNYLTLIFLSDIGVYFMGNDLINKKNVSVSIQHVLGLEQVKFTQASIGKSHAAGIDDLGNLYIWGGPHGSPHLIDSSKVFSSLKSLCGENLTAVVTGGGYLYLFGGFFTSDWENIPYTLAELEKFFIIDACIGPDFCAVITEEGGVYVFDQHKELIKMPCSDIIKKIFNFDHGIFAISEEFVYKWYGNAVRDWQLEVFRSDGNWKVLGNVETGVALQGKCNLEYVKTIEPYRSSIESRVSLVHESRDNPFNFSFMASPKSLTSPNKGNLYPSFFPPDNTFNKLLLYRKQNQQANTIYKLVKSLALPYFQFSWKKIKDFVQIKEMMNRTVNFTNLPIISEKILQRAKIGNLSYAFEKISEYCKGKHKKALEIRKEINLIFRNRVNKLGTILKRILAQEKRKFSNILVGIVKQNIEVDRKKRNYLEKILALSKKNDRIYLSQFFNKWEKITTRYKILSNQLLIFYKIFFEKLASFAFKSLKIGCLSRFEDLKKMKKVLKMLVKKKYLQRILFYFTKWCHAKYNQQAKKNTSKKLYRSLAKNIFSVISHRLKQNVKFAHSKILNKFIDAKLLKKYKHPLLYFASILSKIICRLKFSTFSSIERVRERGNITLNLYFTEKINSLFFVLQKLYQSKLKMAYKALKNKTSSTIFLDTPEQTMTFFNQINTDFDVPSENIEKVPKLALKLINNPSKKPPVATKLYKKVSGKAQTPRKIQTRSGSYGGGSTSREDSLTRRINYDNLLRTKHKNHEKFMNKNEDLKDCINIIKNSKTKHRFLELKNKPRTSPKGNNEKLTKISLGLMCFKRSIEKYIFTCVFKSFSVMKECYLYSGVTKSKCIQHSPHKSSKKLSDYH